MFDTINGAKLSVKRLRDAAGLKASEAKRIVAVVAGCRDWHDLEARVGTSSFPSSPSRADAVARMRSAAPDIDADAAADAIIPEPTLSWSGLRDMDDMEMRAKRGLGQKSWYLNPAVTENEGVTTRRITVHAVESDEYQRLCALVDEDEDAIPDGTCFDRVSIEVHDLRWEMRRGGELVAVAAGTLYDADPRDGMPGYDVDARIMCMDVEEADVGDHESLAGILGVGEGQDTGDVEGSMFVLTHLHVRKAHRRRGIATALARIIAREITERVGGTDQPMIVVDLDAVRGREPERTVEGCPGIARSFDNWTLPIDEHEAVVRRLLRGGIGRILSLGGEDVAIHRADRQAA